MAAATDRIEAAEAGAAAGVVAPPLRRLRDVAADSKSLAEYLDWAATPFGKLAVGALRDLAIWGPPATSGSDAAIQYGVTIGLSLAARILEDPTAVIRVPQPSSPAPDMNFSVSPADALDRLE